ncbi:hypothetical protein [Flavobacterium filum]|uniref:hypothetical protein n=1 Tax=Flavobacterium TaxID=237 RepID=UPI000426F998|nr:hypothetical protein [Flavobacterium filum]
MKYLKILNTVAIGIPIVLAFLGIFDEGMLMYAFVSTMATGFIQVILGLVLLIKNPKNWYFISYITIVILFFGLWYYNVTIYYSDYLTFCLFPIPLLLAIYLSILIYKRKKL